MLALRALHFIALMLQLVACIYVILMLNRGIRENKKIIERNEREAERLRSLNKGR